MSMSDDAPPPPAGAAPPVGDPSDPTSTASLYQWLESRWLGVHMNLLNDIGLNSLADVKTFVKRPNADEAAAQKEKLLALMDKPGLKLKLRVMIEELQELPKPATAAAATPTNGANGSKTTKSGDKEEVDLTDDEGTNGKDDSDDEADPTVSSAERQASGIEVKAVPATEAKTEPTPAVAPVAASSTTPAASTTSAAAAATSPTAEKPLWKAVIDKSTGKTYWYNRVTKETTWNNPIPNGSIPVVTPASPTSDAAKSPKSGEKPLWKAVVDAKSGKTYWYNRVTKETTWNNPITDAANDDPAKKKAAEEAAAAKKKADEEAVIAAAKKAQEEAVAAAEAARKKAEEEAAAAAAKAAAEEAERKRKEEEEAAAAKKKADEEAAAKAKADADAAAAAAPAKTGEKPLWRMVVDKTSGKPYWYNRVTKETTWTDPTGGATAAATTPATATPTAATSTAAATETPTAAAATSPAAGEKPLWKEVKDKASGKPYWYNRVTKETTWVNPLAGAGAAAAATATTDDAAAKKKAEDDAAAAAKKKADEEAVAASAKKAEEEAAAKKKADEEAAAAAAKKKADEEAAAKAAAEAEAKRKADEEAAAAKAKAEAEAAAAKAAAEEAERKRKEEEAAAAAEKARREEEERKAAEAAAAAKAAAEAEAKRKAEEEAAAAAAKKKAEEEAAAAAAKKAAEEAAAKAAAEEAERKRKADEEAAAAKKKAEEEAAAAAKKKAEEEAAATAKAAADAAEAARKKKEEEDAAAKKKAEDDAAAAAAKAKADADAAAAATAAAAAATSPASPASATTDAKPEKPLWKAVVDKASGKTYWYNRITKETTWNNPIPADAAKAETVPASAPTPTATSAPAAVSTPTSPDAKKSTAGEKPLWKAVVDKASGKTYWYNRVTKETTWNNPIPADTAAAAATTTPVATDDAAAKKKAEEEAAAKKKQEDEAAAKKKADEETAAAATAAAAKKVEEEAAAAAAQKKADDEAAATAAKKKTDDDAAAAAAATAAAGATSPTSPAGGEKPLWKSVVDKSSGRTYWYNRVTKETTWINPNPTPALAATTTPAATAAAAAEPEKKDEPAAAAATTESTSSSSTAAASSSSTPAVDTTAAPVRSRDSVSSLPLLSPSAPIPELPPAESDGEASEDEVDDFDENAPLPAEVVAPSAGSTATSTPTKSSPVAEAEIPTKPSDNTNAPLTLKERLAKLQAAGADAPASSGPPPIPAGGRAGAPVSGVGQGLKDRMAALQSQPATTPTSASSNSAQSAEDAEAAARKKEEFKRKQMGVALTIGNQLLMGSMPQLVNLSGMTNKTTNHQLDESLAASESSSNLAASPIGGNSYMSPTAGGGATSPLATEEEEFDREYDIPLTENIREPQKSGFLEKLETAGLFTSKHEYVSRFCLIKDDGFFWLATKKDKHPKGLVCLSDPGMTFFALDHGTELEITTKAGKKLQFKASTPEELQGWTSKMKLAKIMYGAGGAQSGSSFLKALRKPRGDGASSSATVGSLPAGVMSVKPTTEDVEEEPPAPSTAVINAMAAMKPNASMSLAPTGPSAEDIKLWTDMLRAGAMFTKFKYAKGKKRMIWCTQELDRIIWGDAKKKQTKGYIMVCDVTAIRDGCEGTKRKDLAMTLVTQTRLLELEAMDSQQKRYWNEALNWLIGNADGAK